MFKRKDVLKQLNKYIKKSKREIIIMIIVSALAVPVPLISPYLFSLLIDDVLAQKKVQLFSLIIVGLLAVYVIRFLFDFVALICSNKILNRFTYMLRLDVWRKYSRISYKSFEEKNTGDLKMRFFEDVESLGNFLKEQVIDYLYNILVVLVTLGITFYINPMLTLICLTIIPIVFIINILIGKGTKKINEQMRNVNEEYYSFEHNSLQFWKEIKSLNEEEKFIKKFKIFRNRLAKLGYRQIRFWFFNEVFTDFKTNYLTKIIVYILGTTFVLNGDITVGILVMFSELFDILFQSLDTINSKNVALRVNLPYYQRVFEVLNYAEEKNKDKLKMSINGNLKVRNLTFRYNDSKKIILDKVSTKIDSGDFIALVGKSGCGKTTFVKLILNLYDANNGDILLDNMDINCYQKKSLYKQIGVAMQDNYLFNVSIKENLIMANRNAVDEDIGLACKGANILGFINSLTNGFDTVIGEQGLRLSGGQKQRLVIAQALIKKPKIIILDEATSSLDKISEDLIYQSLKNTCNQMTIIMVSHKPSTILRAEHVIILDKGEIIADGKVNELMNENDYIKNLVG